MSFSAKRWAYSDMPSQFSHSAIVDITFRPGRLRRTSIVRRRSNATGSVEPASAQ